MPKTSKACNKCGVEKPLTEFYPDRRNTDGKAGKCRTCRTAESRQWATDNPDRYKAKQRRLSFLRHGIELSDDQLLPPPSCRCAICGTATPGGQGGFHLDHCHTTNTVRGWLCHSCNTKLGWYEANAAAITKYIQHYAQNERGANGNPHRGRRDRQPSR